jgi:hypothetical protein
MLVYTRTSDKPLARVQAFTERKSLGFSLGEPENQTE